MTTHTGNVDTEIDLDAHAAIRTAMNELSRGDAANQLEAAARLRHAAESLVAELVVKARNNGSTWADIGETLGVSTQAAHQKYRYVATAANS